MAIKSGSQGGAEAMTSGRRFAIGANVAIAVVAAAALLVAVNWVSSIKHVRKDIATLGGYGLSERTLSILDAADGEIAIAMVYEPDDEDAQQAEHIERLREFLDELAARGDAVTVSHVATDSQRERLVADLSGKFGGEADEHRGAIEAIEATITGLSTELDQRFAQAQALINGDSWLGDFPLFAEVARMLRQRKTELAASWEDISDLIPAGGIPKYAEATRKAKTDLAAAKRDLEGIADFLDRLNKLAEEAGRADSENIKMLREVAAEPSTLIASLREIVGANDAPAADTAATLKAYADRSVAVRNDLAALVRRVQTFAVKYPMVKQHPNWSALVRQGPFQSRMSVASVLQQAAEALRKSRLQLLGVIDTANPDELIQALNAARGDVSILEQNAAAANELLVGLAIRLSRMDDASKALLEEARDGALFKDRITAITDLEKRIDDLPELKLGSIADQLKGKNILVVMAGDKVRVLTYEEVFPVRQSVAGPGGGNDADLGRVFNGDSAIASALLAATREHPFATIVLTSFEAPAPQQRGPFSMPPPQSRVPSNQLSEVRKRLEGANFKVVDWNMATTDVAPVPEEGTENVYVLLPPPAAGARNPFNQSAVPPPTLGDKERRKIQDILNNDGRVLFVAAWEVTPSGPFGGSLMAPPYRYNPILESDWGITVQTGLRLVWVLPELGKPNSFSVALQKFQYMPGGAFTDHAVGKPMRGTRFLVAEACPVHVMKDAPDNVTHEVVQTVYEHENYIGVGIDDLIRIVDTIKNPASEGVVTLGDTLNHGPFNLLVTAERRDGEDNKGRIAVLTYGVSLTDQFLTQPVLRQGDKIRFDPPPTESADLLANTLFWLQGQERWIARGPRPKPTVEPVTKDKLFALRVVLYAAWPVLVFVPGIVAWYVRRR